MNQTNNLRERVLYLDIAKGIGILLVVWAHASGPFSAQIDQFHMPLFFLISGYLYSQKSTVKEYIWKKTKSLYLPFMFWNLLSYSITYFITTPTVDWLKFFISALEIILTLSKDGQFFGATWFLGALFVMSILYKLVDTVIPQSQAKDGIMLLFFITLALLGFEVNFPYMLSRTFILGMFFALGVFIKKHQSFLATCNAKGTAIVCLLLFFLISKYNSVKMGPNHYDFRLLFIFGACFASYAVIYLSQLMEVCQNKCLKLVKSAFIYLGQHSIDIVLWHFIFFRLSIILQMYLHQETLTVKNILSYYPIYSADHGWWVVYLFIGILLPLLWGKLLRIGIWGKLFSKLHIV